MRFFGFRKKERAVIQDLLRRVILLENHRHIEPSEMRVGSDPATAPRKTPAKPRKAPSKRQILNADPTLGRKVHAYRKACKLTQSDFAECTGISRQAISNLESGRVTHARTRKAARAILKGCDTTSHQPSLEFPEWLTFAKDLRNWRTIRNITQGTIAQKTGVPAYKVSLLERGLRIADRAEAVAAIEKLIRGPG